MHWHPNADEWLYFISGKGRATIFTPNGARTTDFNANDVGVVPRVMGHYIENTGDTELVYLEVFKASEFLDFSLNNWLRHVPPEMVQSHLNLDENTISKIPAAKLGILPG